MREVRLKWFRQAYLEERPDNVFTEFMTEDGHRYQTFEIPYGDSMCREGRTAEFLSSIAKVIDEAAVASPVICGESK